MPDGSYGGVPGGWLLKLDEQRVYFACDTALFLDMKLIGAGGLDLAVLPIGDLYTMGPDDSLDADQAAESRSGSPPATTTPGRRSSRTPGPGPSGSAPTRPPSRSSWSRAKNSGCSSPQKPKTLRIRRPDSAYRMRGDR